MSVQPKSLIPEVSILRPITIVLLVLMHSFTVFDNSWRPFDGYIDIEVYKWMTRVSFSCMLEMFVFLSGYVLAYQIITLGRSYKWIDFVKRKFQRLIIPSVVFSVIYILILQSNQLTIKNLMGGVFCSHYLKELGIYGFCLCCSGALLRVIL